MSNLYEVVDTGEQLHLVCKFKRTKTLTIEENLIK